LWTFLDRWRLATMVSIRLPSRIPWAVLQASACPYRHTRLIRRRFLGHDPSVEILHQLRWILTLFKTSRCLSGLCWALFLRLPRQGLFRFWLTAGWYYLTSELRTYVCWDFSTQSVRCISSGAEIGEHLMETNTMYSRAWKEYRSRRAWSIAFFIAFLALPLIGRNLLPPVGWAHALLGYTTILLFTVAAIQGYRLALWPCPKCGRTFRGTIPFPRRCRSCGLPIWS